LIWHSFLPGRLGIEHALYGLGAGLLAMLPLYLLRATGAGDVKLMAMVGVFLGPREAIGAVLCTWVAGALIALAFAAMNGALIRMAHNLRVIFHSYCAKLAGVEGPTFDSRLDSAARLPYSVAIALGTASFLGLKQLYS
jgi:prepilin peptidase CpaA